jgi:asparagine N-glycosylation enzyme membrane subunit Stt3
MLRKYENKFFVFIFLIVSLLVFLSRQIQINFINRFHQKFYLFNDPIFNPDGYYYLTIIKNLINSQSIFIEKLSENFLGSVFLLLSNLFININLPQLVMLSSPYFVVFAFLSIFFFFWKFSNKEIALLASFTYVISEIFISRSNVLFFDTDTLNIFFVFSILCLLCFYLDENLNRKKFYLISVSLIILNKLFFFHYPKIIFSIIFLTILLIIFFNIKNKFIDKFIVLSFFLYISLPINLWPSMLDSLLIHHKIYSQGQSVSTQSLISVSSSVSELNIYNIFEIEKIIFNLKIFGIGLLASLFGLILFIKTNKLKIIFYIPLIIFTYLTLTKGIRFLIYISPFVYFGFFYFFYYLITLIKNKYKLKNDYINKLSYLFLFILIWNISIVSCNKNFSLSCNQKFSLAPHFNSQIIKGIIKFNNIDEKYNIITSLDYGYLINYYTNSTSIIHPGSAFNKNKYSLFYSPKKLTNEYVKSSFNIKNDFKNYIFLTTDFIKWWPTIAKLYTNKNDKISQILEFSCKEYQNNKLNCESENGLETEVDINNGYIDNEKIIHKLIINSKQSYLEKIIDENGEAIVVYTPGLKRKNLYVIFPKRFQDLIFIKYFFSKLNNAEVSLVDDGWPHYRSYKINN